MEINKAEMASAASVASSGQELRGAEILVKALQAENVQFVWGYPGGAVLHIYDAFYKQETIQHVLVRHEQAAVHAADGYARATGEVGVALVTSGPGLTNAVTGIATAYMDSIPMVIISGQVPTAAIGLDAFQECDTVGITRPIVKLQAAFNLCGLFCVFQLPRFINQHDWNAVTNRERQSVGFANEFLSGLVEQQRPFADRANKNFK
jgi:thiamine pyrophosphate-dependent acetolactate synthase large subunit-like protein